MKRGFNIGLLYLSFHNQLKKKVGLNRILSRKDIKLMLGKHFLVPKNVTVCVIRELELMNLIKKIDKDSYKLLDYNLDIERDVNLFYNTLKIFE